MITLRFDIETVSEANRAGHEHWRRRQKRAKAQRHAFRYLWKQQSPPKVTLPTTVTFIRYATRRLDHGDNLPMAFKHVRDELAAIIGIDDSDERIEWRHEQRPKDRAEKVRNYFELIIKEQIP